MSKDITELEDGRIHVRLSSKRGTGTRDEDKVVSETVYPDFGTAIEDGWKLNKLVSERLHDARKVTNPPEEADSRPEFRSRSQTKINEDIGSEGSNSRVETKESENQENVSSNSSKVYIGKGGKLKGWNQVPREVVYEEIAPLVANNQVKGETSGVKINFSSDIPLSGWNTVDKKTVRKEIVPLIKENRLNGDNTPSQKSFEGEATCPLDWCSYSGSIEQVLGHVTGSDDHTQDRQPQLECPVESCDRTGAVGTIAGHFFSIWDGEHTPDKLLKTDIF